MKIPYERSKKQEGIPQGSSVHFLGAPRVPETPFGFSWMAPLELKSFPPLWEPLMTNLQLNYTLFSLPFQGKKNKKRLCEEISEVIKISPGAAKRFPSRASSPSASAPREKYHKLDLLLLQGPPK